MHDNTQNTFPRTRARKVNKKKIELKDSETTTTHTAHSLSAFCIIIIVARDVFF